MQRQTTRPLIEAGQHCWGARLKWCEATGLPMDYRHATLTQEPRHRSRAALYRCRRSCVPRHAKANPPDKKNRSEMRPFAITMRLHPWENRRASSVLAESTRSMDTFITEAGSVRPSTAEHTRGC
jgi:hypothetical protein